MPPERTAKDKIREQLYLSNPNLFRGLLATFEDLHAMVRVYGEKRRLDLSQQSLVALTNLLVHYLKIRTRTLQMPTSMLGLVAPLDATFDEVLTTECEFLGSILRGAVAVRDQQFAMQIISSFETVALAAVNCESRFPEHGENSTVAFLSAYMFGAVEGALSSGLEDVVLTTARALTRVARVLASKKIYLTTTSLVGNLQNLAFLGILHKKSTVIGQAIKGISEVLTVSVLTPAVRVHLIKESLEAIQNVTVQQLRIGFDLDYPVILYSLGPFWDSTQPTSLVGIQSELTSRVDNYLKRSEWAQAVELLDAVEELDEDLWQMLSAAGVEAASKESFLLHYLLVNVESLCESIFYLRGASRNVDLKPRDLETAQLRSRFDRFVKESDRTLAWLVIGVFSRVLSAMPKTPKRRYGTQILESIESIIIHALAQSESTLAKELIEFLTARTKIKEEGSVTWDLSDLGESFYRVGVVATHHKDRENSAAAAEGAKAVISTIERLPDSDRIMFRLERSLDELEKELRGGRFTILPRDVLFQRNSSPDAWKEFSRTSFNRE